MSTETSQTEMQREIRLKSTQTKTTINKKQNQISNNCGMISKDATYGNWNTQEKKENRWKKYLQS